MFFSATFVYLQGNLRVRLATQSKPLGKFNLWPLATTCESVCPELYKVWRALKKLEFPSAKGLELHLCSSHVLHNYIYLRKVWTNSLLFRSSVVKQRFLSFSCLSRDWRALYWSGPWLCALKIIVMQSKVTTWSCPATFVKLFPYLIVVFTLFSIIRATFNARTNNLAAFSIFNSETFSDQLLRAFGRFRFKNCKKQKKVIVYR